MIAIGTPIGLRDADGRELLVGDECQAIRGWASHKKFKGLTATVVYKDGFFAWKWSDGYMNPYPICVPQNWRVIPKA